MMQNGQPVANVSQALSSAEIRYAQIEKELLVVLFACYHFDAYIYERSRVNIETNHKPLESIVLKPLNDAPKRLQRKLVAPATKIQPAVETQKRDKHVSC